MFQSLTNQGIDKKYHVRVYKNFPFKKDSDKVVRVFDKLEEAQAESIFLNEYDVEGKKYYAMDYPHEWIKADEKIEKEYKEKLDIVINYLDKREENRVRAKYGSK